MPSDKDRTISLDAEEKRLLDRLEWLRTHIKELETGENIRICRRRRDGSAWVVKYWDRVMTTDLEWICEPMPSNRDEEYTARAYHSLEKAIELAGASMGELRVEFYGRKR